MNATNRAREMTMTPTSPTQSHNAQRSASEGFISIAALWILGALCLLSSIYAVYVINTASAFAVYDDHLKAEGLISAALELTAYQQQMGSAQSRPTHGAFGFRMGQANIDVQFSSEAARIDLNTAPKQLLSGLLATLGAPPDKAEVYADRIISWRTPSQGDRDSEASAYRMAHLSYQPRFGKFPHPNELSLVRDLPTSLVARALPFLTVYSGRPHVNVLDAAPDVVASLPGMTQERLNAFLLQRTVSPENAKQLLPTEAQQYATLEASQTFRVKVRINFDSGRTENAEVITLFFEEGDQPFAVLSWRDDTEMIAGITP
jgi:general secretion pathway protein K